MGSTANVFWALDVYVLLKPRFIDMDLTTTEAPWGGHSVFPNIYKDMRHPHKYSKSVDITYSLTFGLDMSLAFIGALMFGNLVKDEVREAFLAQKYISNDHRLLQVF